MLNANKLSVALNLSTPEGVGVARRLALRVDAVAENFAPGAMAKWGLDYASLVKERPDLVMISTCLNGQTGPQRFYPGFGGQGSALSGFNHLTGWPDREPVGPYGTITDSLSPRFAALLLATALLHRGRTGQGQHIDLSQVEGGIVCLSESIATFTANGDVARPDGQPLTACRAARRLPLRRRGRPRALDRHRDPRRRRTGSASSRRSARRTGPSPRSWERCPAASRTPRRSRTGSPSGRARSARRRWPSASSTRASTRPRWPTWATCTTTRSWRTAGTSTPSSIRCSASHPVETHAIRFSDMAPSLRRPAPRLGEHTDTVLRDLLDMSADEIARLREAGVLD